MTTVRQYWNSLVATRNTVALRLGVSVPDTQKTARALANADLALVAVVCKAIVDKGLLTDADLQAARDAAIADTWNDEPDLP
jgi:hypothetical protein